MNNIQKKTYIDKDETDSMEKKMLGVEIADDFAVTQHVQQLHGDIERADNIRECCGPARAFQSTAALQHVRLPFYHRRSIDVRSYGVVSPRHRIARASTRSSTARPLPWLMLAGPANQGCGSRDLVLVSVLVSEGGLEQDLRLCATATLLVSKVESSK